MDSGFALLGSPWLVAAVFVIVFAASIVQVGLGMGFGLTAAPLLALLNPELVPASTLFVGLLTASWGAWRERGEIAWSEVGIALTGRVAGVAAATMILASLTDHRTFMLIFGVMIGIAILTSISGRRIAFSRAAVGVMGVVSGVMATITSVGAPPMALVYQSRPAKTARPTLSAFFAVGCGISLVGLYLAGWAGRHDLLLAITMLPPMFAGIFTARLLRDRFDARYRGALLSISALAAAILIIRGLT